MTNVTLRPLPLLLFALTAGCGDDDAGGAGGGGGSTTATSSSTTAASSSTTGAGGGTTTGAGGGSSSTGAGGDGACELDPPHTPAAPPPAPAGASPATGPREVFAFSALLLGETDRSGTPSPTAWQGYGFDLDGVNTADVDGDDRVTGDDLVCHCSPPQGEVVASNLEDGPAGVDNSFGRNILAFLGAAIEAPSAQASEALATGLARPALVLDAIGPESDAAPAPGGWLALRGGEDGTWEVAPKSVVGDDPEAPAVRFEDAYLTGDTWVARAGAPLDLDLFFGDTRWTLRIHGAVITMSVAGDRESAAGGVLAGTLDLEELVAGFAEFAPVLLGSTEGLCPGDPLMESILQNFRAAADLLADGSQASGASCAGVSIALGFEAEAVEVGGLAPPDDPLPAVCP